MIICRNYRLERVQVNIVQVVAPVVVIVGVVAIIF